MRILSTVSQGAVPPFLGGSSAAAIIDEDPLHGRELIHGVSVHPGAGRRRSRGHGHLPERGRRLRRRAPSTSRGHGRRGLPAGLRLLLRRRAIPRPDRRGRLGPPLPPRRRRHQLQEPRLRRDRRPGEQHPQPAGRARGPQGRRLPPAAPVGERLRGGRRGRLPGTARLLPLRTVQGPHRPGLSLLLRRAGIGLGKFVIPNPFGPYEEPRFTAYLIKNWLAGATPNCSSPAYVRDNIHVSLLAKVYARFARTSRPRASPGSIPAATPRARAPSRSAWPRRCAPAWGSPALSS